ncbi:unnamed protein product [Phaeothamnion confervicola]
MGSLQAARKLGIGERQAAGIMAAFMHSFPGVSAFMERTRRQARETGMARTITGRIRHLPEINSLDQSLRAQAERQAVNSVIQGTAADVIKLAMHATNRRLLAWQQERQRRGAAGGAVPRMLLQIHDELIFEVPGSEQDILRLRELLRECMEADVVRELGLRVPMRIKMSVGMSWGQMRVVLNRTTDR